LNEPSGGNCKLPSLCVTQVRCGLLTSYTPLYIISDKSQEGTGEF
jgi:hypothetical protein